MISKFNSSNDGGPPPPAFLMTKSPKPTTLRKRPDTKGANMPKKSSSTVALRTRPTTDSAARPVPKKTQSLPRLKTTTRKTFAAKTKTTETKEEPCAPVKKAPLKRASVKKSPAKKVSKRAPAIEESPRSTVEMVDKFSRMKLPLTPPLSSGNSSEEDAKPELTELTSRTSNSSLESDLPSDGEESIISIDDLEGFLEREKAKSKQDRRARFKKESSVRWNESIVTEVCDISVCSDTEHDMLFYSERELADFRYEAFIESCGLDPSEYE